MTNTPIKTLLVDDHALVREALGDKLQQQPDFVIVGCAENGDQALRMAEEFQPDIVIFDIDMPGLDPFEAARQIKSRRPAVHIVFLSGHVQDNYIEQALAIEASGYLTKRESNEALIGALRQIHGGELFFSEEVRRRLVVDVDKIRLSQQPRSRFSTLTHREREILRYIAQGLSKKEIASALNLSVKTVETHSSNLMSKLGIHDRVELARFAIREGLAQL
jgi:DNA-binding NarL/FixJ family response regulator